MAARQWTVRRFAVVAMGLLLTGCAEMVQRRLGHAEDASPPAPAPLLHIADPPTKTAPTLAQAEPVILPTAASGGGRGEPPASIVPARAEGPAISVIRALHQKALQRYQSMESYTLRLRRREVVAGKTRPEELMLVKFREQPWSVYFKWIGPEGKGREVVYVKGRPGNEIHTLTANGDVLLLPAGQRFSLNADSPLVKSRSRYPITDAGLGTTIRKFAAIVEGVEKGDPRQGTLKYLSQVKRPEFEEPVDGVEQTVPPNSDPLLPGGGRRWFYFNSLGLPALIMTQDEAGREVEYYCHDRILSPVHLDDDDFNPDKLWGKRK